MIYMLNDKKVRIPDCDIEHLVATMGIDKDEAVQIWLEDEGYLVNEEQEALVQKAKENRITAAIHQASAKDPAKKTQRERVVKPNPDKEDIIKGLAKWLDNAEMQNVVVENKGKIITFEYNGKQFKLDLIEKRKPKTLEDTKWKGII